jgi:hypothetical protein
MGMAIIGAVISGVGAIMGGMQQAAMANYQAKVAEQQAKVAKRNAYVALEANEEEQNRIKEENRARLGSVKAAYAGSGVDVNTGTASMAVESTQKLGADIARQSVREGQEKWYAHMNQSDSLINQSRLYRMKEKADRMAGLIGGATNLVKGVAAIGGTY